MGHIEDAIESAESWGAGHARRMGVFDGHAAREAGVTLDDHLPGPLSGEWAGSLTPMTLAYEVLGLDYDLDEVLEDEDARWSVLDVLCDAYEEGFYLAVDGQAVPCVTSYPYGICEEPGTFCDCDMVRATAD